VYRNRAGAASYSQLRFPGAQIADHLAERLNDIGLDVTMMDVVHPFDPTIPAASRSAFAAAPVRVRPDAQRHMDPGLEMPDGRWTLMAPSSRTAGFGHGRHDDKGGIAAAFCGVEAIIRSGTAAQRRRALCPVIAHKLGGAGTEGAAAQRRAGASVASYGALQQHHRQCLVGIRDGAYPGRGSRAVLPL